MEDLDYDKLFSSLADTLREKQLVWVLDQVNEQIRLGKTESKEITADEVDQQRSLPGMRGRAQTTRGRRRKKEEFLVTTEYTAREKLLLLIDAIEQAVVNSNRMVQETLDFVGQKFNIPEITFYSTDNQREKAFSSRDFVESSQRVKHLKDSLDELRRQVNAD